MATAHATFILVLFGLMAVGRCVLASPDPATADAAVAQDTPLGLLDPTPEAR